MIVGLDMFNYFSPLIEKGIFGGTTLLLECSKCQSLWIQCTGGHLRHLLYPSAKEMFFQFHDSANTLSKEHKSIISTIGSPKFTEETFEYPASIITKSGEIITNASIQLSNLIWPIANENKPVRFIKEINKICLSDEAMSLEQRQALVDTNEIQMGSAYLFLEKENEMFMISKESLFIPSSMGHPKDFKIMSKYSHPVAEIICKPVVRFLGHF